MAEFTTINGQAKSIFILFEADKAAMEAEIRWPLIWHNPPDTHSAGIYVRRAADLRDRGS